MSEPTVSPVQRNSLDVIMELLNLHILAERRQGNDVNSDEIEALFIKYYKLYAQRNSF